MTYKEFIEEITYDRTNNEISKRDLENYKIVLKQNRNKDTVVYKDVEFTTINKENKTIILITV